MGAHRKHGEKIVYSGFFIKIRIGLVAVFGWLFAVPLVMDCTLKLAYFFGLNIFYFKGDWGAGSAYMNPPLMLVTFHSCSSGIPSKLCVSWSPDPSYWCVWSRGW